MSRSFLLGDGVPVNLDALVDTRLLVQANSGGGKSWLLRRLLDRRLPRAVRRRRRDGVVRSDVAAAVVRLPHAATLRSELVRRSGWGAGVNPGRKGRIREDDRTCVYCGGAAATVDHVVPRSVGGAECQNNLVAACLTCNATKGQSQIVGLPLACDGAWPLNGRGGFLAWLMWRRVKHSGVLELVCPRTGERTTMQLCPVGTAR